MKNPTTKSVTIVAALALFALTGGTATAQTETGLREFLAGAHLHGLSIDPENPTQIFLATHSGLFRVDLNRMQTTPIGAARDDFMGFSTDLARPGRMFASGHDAGMTKNLGIIGSDDGGTTWVSLSAGVDGPVDFHQMELSRADPAWLYGVFGGNVQQSRDNGLNWQVIGAAPEGLIDIATSARDSGQLYAATRSGLLQSADAGASWTMLRPSQQPVSFVDVGSDGSIYAFVLGEGLISSDDGGLAWTAVNNGFGDGYILNFSRDPKNLDRMFATTGKNEIVVSSNGGKDWTLVARP